MRVGIFSLALLGSSANGCLRGASRGVIGEPSAETERGLQTRVVTRTISAKPSEVDAHSREDEADKIMSIYKKRLEGKQALKMACGSEKEFAKCKLRKGFGSALNLAECLIKEGGGPISDRCAKGIEDWKSVLAETSKAGARFPAAMLGLDSGEDMDVLVPPPKATKHKFGDKHEKHGPSGHGPGPHDHKHGLQQDHQFSRLGKHEPLSGHQPHGPPGRGPPGHGPPKHGSPLSFLTGWMFDHPEDSSDSSDSFEGFSIDSSDSSEEDDRVMRHGPTHHMNAKHVVTMSKNARAGDAELVHMHGSFVHDHNHHQHGDHLRYRNRLPEEFEDPRFERGSDLIESILAFFFFVGAFTLLLLPFFLMGRAIKLMVRNARRASRSSSVSSDSMPPAPASSGFGACPVRRRVDTANAAAAAEGYQALPEDSSDESNDDDAIVVTGMPVNPPPSVNV